MTPEKGDNFDLVYDADGWRCEAPPELMLALMLYVFLNER